MIKPEHLSQERANQNIEIEKKANLAMLESMIDKKMLEKEYDLLAGDKVGISFHRNDDPFDNLSEVIKKYEENGWVTKFHRGIGGDLVSTLFLSIKK